MLLKDKIALLLTGSTHNIGLAIARAFAREGANVIVHSRHGEDAKKIAARRRYSWLPTRRVVLPIQFCRLTAAA